MKYFKIFLIFIVIVLLILLIYKNSNKKNSIELTQFSSTDKSIQMMGYKIKTKSGKLILIDGGTKHEANQLIEDIHKNGNKVDYWFITHPHHDHAEAFCEVVENTRNSN